MEQVKTPQVLKPDFQVEALAYADLIERRLTSYHDGLKTGYAAGMERVWSDFVEPSNQFKEEIERLNKEIEYLQKSKDGYINDAVENKELHPKAAELYSLKTSILESSLRQSFPEKEMSFHDKVVFAIHDVTEENARLREVVEELNRFLPSLRTLVDMQFVSPENCLELFDKIEALQPQK